MSTVPLLSDNNILFIGLATVASTGLLSSFALFSEPDLALLSLLCVCFMANYAWIQHIDSGWGSENALTMFKMSMVVGVVGLFGGVYRRWRYPEVRVRFERERAARKSSGERG